MTHHLDQVGCNNDKVRDDMKRYLAAFDEYDKDHSGTLDKEEIRNILKKAGAESDTNKYFNYCDADGDGRITKAEFMKGLCGFTLEENFQKICIAYDKDKSGTLEKNEIIGALKDCGFDVSGAEADGIDRLIKKLDKNGDGQLQYDEFISGFLKEKLAK